MKFSSLTSNTKEDIHQMHKMIDGPGIWPLYIADNLLHFLTYLPLTDLTGMDTHMCMENDVYA